MRDPARIDTMIGKVKLSDIRTVIIEALAGVGLRACIDNSCLFGPPGGMGTNGGCRCFEHGINDRRSMAKLALAIRDLSSRLVETRSALTEALDEWQGFVDASRGIELGEKPRPRDQREYDRIAASRVLTTSATTHTARRGEGEE